MPETASVDINFSEKTATITAKSRTTISRSNIEVALKNAGYGVTSFAER